MTANESRKPRVLVTYDGSSASAAALGPAARIARLMGAEIVLLRVHHPALKLAVNPDPDERERLMREVEASFQAELERLAADLDADVRPLVRRLGVRWNVPAEVIHVADEFEVEMICMATHGDSAVRHFIAGSTAMEVLSNSTRPVLLVRSAD